MFCLLALLLYISPCHTAETKRASFLTSRWSRAGFACTRPSFRGRCGLHNETSVSEECSPDFRRSPSVETLSPTGANEEEETSSELQHVLLALISIAQTPAAPLPPGCSHSGAYSQIQALSPAAPWPYHAFPLSFTLLFRASAAVIKGGVGRTLWAMSQN